MKIGILGAGSIGCYVGGMLATNGNAPLLVGRAGMGARLICGIELTRHDGMRRKAQPGSFSFSQSPDALAECDTILICVKSIDTRIAGETLAAILRPGTLVVSLQNGISNAQMVQAAIPEARVLAGMVGFNVVQIGENRFHCGTDGSIIIGQGGEELAGYIRDAGIPSSTRADMEAVQWGKLLLNLNNAVNALSGLPLQRQLSTHGYRQVVAETIREALAALDAAHIHPARVGKVPPALLAPMLEFPDWLFARLAASMLKVDADARSSMAEDLEQGRPPEIDWLNGEVAALGRRYGVATPVNDQIVALVKSAFSGEGQRSFTADELKDAVFGPRQ